MSRLNIHHKSADRALKGHLLVPKMDKGRLDSETSEDVEDNSDYGEYERFYQCPQAPSAPVNQSKKSKWRSFIIDELIENEYKFYNEMRMLSLLLTSGDIGLEISADDFKAIYLNLGDYITISREILSSLIRAKRAVNDPIDACVARSFLNLIPKYKEVLLAFVKDYDPQLLDKRKHLKKYFDTATQILHERDGSTLKLNDRIIVAFQRPFKIICLFERLQKETPPSHPDHEGVVEVVKQMTEMTECAEKLKRSDSQYMMSDYSTEDAGNGKIDILADLKHGVGGNIDYCRSQCDKICKFSEFLVKWINITTESIITHVTQNQTFTHKVDQLKSSIKLHQSNLNEPLNPGRSKMMSFEKFRDKSGEIASKLTYLIKILKKPKAVEKEIGSYLKEYRKAKRHYSVSSDIPQNILKKLLKYRSLQIHLGKQLQELHRTATTVITICEFVYKIEVMKVIISSEPASILNTPEKKDIIIRSTKDIPSALNACVKLSLPPSGTSPFTRAPLYSSEKLPQSEVNFVKKLSTIKNSSFRTTSNATIKFFYDSPLHETSHLKVGEVVIVENIGDDSGNVEWTRIRTTSNHYYWYPTNYLTNIQ